MISSELIRPCPSEYTLRMLCPEIVSLSVASIWLDSAKKEFVVRMLADVEAERLECLRLRSEALSKVSTELARVLLSIARVAPEDRDSSEAELILEWSIFKLETEDRDSEPALYREAFSNAILEALTKDKELRDRRELKSFTESRPPLRKAVWVEPDIRPERLARELDASMRRLPLAEISPLLSILVPERTVMF